MRINGIIHPYFLESRVYDNQLLYNGILENTLNDPNAMLYYVATLPNLSTRDRFANYYTYGEEIEFQQQLQALDDETKKRVAILDSEGGHCKWETTRLYDVSGFSGRYGLMSHTDGTPFDWFYSNGVSTFYNRDLTSVYLDITDMDPRRSIFFWRRDNLRDNGRRYVTAELNPQLAKLIRFIGIDKTDTKILDEDAMSIPRELRERINIFSSGEFIEACVFVESVNLALALGIPMQNLSLNNEQPYVVHEGRSDFEVYRKPAEVISREITQRMRS